MSRHQGSWTSALILAIAGLLLQAPSTAGQLTMAEAAQDPTLAPWQQQLMLDVAQGGPGRAAAEPSAMALDPDPDGAWSELFPPSARSGHTAIYDPVRDRMVVFGGSDDSSVRNDVWVLSLSGSPAWSALTPAGSPPSARAWHTAIYDPVRDRMVVFGGTDATGQRDDVWALSLSGSPAWSALTPTGTPPSARGGHTAIYDPVRDRMVVFGGSDVSLRNDTWALSLAGPPAWSALAPAGGPPPARLWHAAIYDPVRDRMVVFGGRDGDWTYANDAWALKLSGSPMWTALAPAGSLPSARFGHAAIYDPAADRMIVFGGTSGAADPNDVWALSLAGSPAWSTLAPAGTLPSGRSAHTAIYDLVRDRIVVFGGVGAVRLDDAWALSLAGSPGWSALAPEGGPPPGRWAHTAIYDPLRARMVVFGGFYGRNDAWALSLAGSPVWSPLVAAGSPPPARNYCTAIYDPVRDRMVVFGGGVGASYLDVWALSLSGSPAWSELAPTGSLPPVRDGHTAIYDPVRDCMVVFGGGGNEIYSRNDVWTLSLAGGPAWSELAPGGSLPMSRREHTAIYDPVRDRMVVFGGLYSDRGYFTETWALPLSGSPAWSLLAPTGPPAIRRGHTAIYDPVRDRMVVFGGVVSGHFNSLARNDTWSLVWGSTTVSALVSLVHALAEPDRVSLTWYGSESSGMIAWVERREANTDWQRLATLSADGTGMFRYDDRAVAPGARYAYRLAYRDGEGAETLTEETWVDVPVTVSLALEGLRPNPAGAELVAVFALPDGAPAVLTLLDISGRQVLAHDVGSLGAGRHALRLSHARDLPAGIYWLRLERMGTVRLAKAIILR